MSFRMAILLILDLMSEMTGKGGRSVCESGYTKYRDGVVKALIEL